MAIGKPTTGLTHEIDIPTSINSGLTCPAPNQLVALLGDPRTTYSQMCQPVSNANLRSMIQTANVGPFMATGLRPAIYSLKVIMSEARVSLPDVYSKLGSAGMLCCRKQRGSSRISSHSWGTAIDLTLDGKLDVRGNKKVLFGLSLIAPIFNRHGWYWGVQFRTEDAMHFEVSKGRLDLWKSSGQLGSAKTLRRGDKGSAVNRLQAKLNQHGPKLVLDGDFGANTESAVRRFQLANGLSADGIVGSETNKALGIN